MSAQRVEQILSEAARTAHERRYADVIVSLPAVLCAACAEELPVTGVGLALVNEQGSAGLVAATDGLATLMEQPQFSLGEGPYVDSSAQGRPVLQPELRITGLMRTVGLPVPPSKAHSSQHQ